MKIIELEVRYDYQWELVEVPIMVLGFRMGWCLRWKKMLVVISKDDPRYENAPIGERFAIHPHAFSFISPRDEAFAHQSEQCVDADDRHTQ